MDKIRDFMQSWQGKLLLVLIMIPMAFMGIQSFSNGGITTGEVIKVGNTTVGLTAYQNELNESRLRLTTEVDASFINEQALADEVLERLIQRALLENQIKFLGMTVSDEAIARLLQQEAQFQDSNGKFSNDLFANYLRASGMTKDVLFDNFRNQLSLRQLTLGILGTAIYSDDQISRLIDLQTQSREVWVHRYGWQDFADKVTVTDADLETYYNAHQEELLQSAMVDLSYIEVVPESIKVDEPTEEEIATQYQSYLQNNGLAENRELAQILLTGDDVQARIKQIQDKLAAGESFEALAKTYSDDPTGESGGNIGVYNAAVFGDDAKVVEAAIANLKTGQVSEPVKTNFGYQFFKIVKMSDVPTLDSMRDEIVKQAIEYKRQTAFSDLATKINDMATDGMDIADIAASTGIKAQTIKNYPKENNQTALAIPSVITAAFDDFAIQDQSVSPNITLPNKTVWVQSTNYQEAKTLTLQEAKERVKQAVLQEKASQLAFEMASAQAEQAKQNPATLAVPQASVGMVNSQTGVLSRAEKASLFVHDSAEGMDVWAVQTEQGASVLVGSPIISVSQSRLSNQERMQTARVIRDNVGQDQFNDYLQYLRDTKEVVINEQEISGR